MNYGEKQEYVENMRKKLLGIVEYWLKRKNYEIVLEALAAYSELMYQWNQTYFDQKIEDYISEIGNRIVTPSYSKAEANSEKILFYDPSGLDARGLSIIYVRALLKLGYEVVYVTGIHAKEHQPVFHNTFSGEKIAYEYFPFYDRFLLQIQGIQKIINRHKPIMAFIHSGPSDVTGAMVFSSYAQIVKRYLINLTDHAFWIGKNAFDYCIEFRDYGANISKKFREISESKIIKLPFYPSYSDNMPFEGFPFDRAGKKVIFSGGALYKTYGEGNIYYKIVENILNHDEKTVFLYAGEGNRQELNKLISEFPKRVFLIEERKDLFQLMRNIDIYLNTYPMIGGLMTQYAAIAGKVPVTLVHDNDARGLLLNENELEVYYDNVDELTKDIYRMLDEPEYLKSKEERLNGCVINEEEFIEELNNIIQFGKTKFTIENDLFSIDDIEKLQREYIVRFFPSSYEKTFGEKRKIFLCLYFPKAFFKTCLKKIICKIKRVLFKT